MSAEMYPLGEALKEPPCKRNSPSLFPFRALRVFSGSSTVEYRFKK